MILGNLQVASDRYPLLFMSPTPHALFIRSMEALSDRLHALAPPHVILRVADLSLLSHLDPETPLAPSFRTMLSPHEQSILARFTRRKRYQEWLGGRLAAKTCFTAYCRKNGHSPPLCAEFSILANKYGKPSILTADTPLPLPTVSISHSGTYAAACLSPDAPCGIDAQRITSKLERVAEKFTDNQEKSLFHDKEKPLHTLAILWAVKEAVKKCLLADHSVTFSATTAIGAERQAANLWVVHCHVAAPIGQTATVHAGFLHDYVVACATGDNHA